MNGIKAAVRNLLDIPKVLKTDVVFDQSIFVKIAVKNVINEGTIGLCLTAVMEFYCCSDGCRPRLPYSFRFRYRAWRLSSSL